MGLFDFLKPKKNPKLQPEDDEGNSINFDLTDHDAADSDFDADGSCDCGDCGDSGSSD